MFVIRDGYALVAMLWVSRLELGTEHRAAGAEAAQGVGRHGTAAQSLPLGGAGARPLAPAAAHSGVSGTQSVPLGLSTSPPPAEVACVYPAGAAHAVLRGAGQAPPGGGVQHASPPNAFDGPSLLASGAERGVAAPGTGFGAPAACGSRRARVGRANEELATMPATALRPPASPLLTACTRCHPEKSQTHRKPPGFRRAHSARQAATNDRQRSLRQEEACEGCSVRGPERCR